MNRERVLFVAPAAYTLGGVATWLDYLVPGLSAAGFAPVLGLTAGDHHDVDAYVAAHPAGDIVTLRNPSGSAEGRVRAVADAIQRVRPSVVLAVNVVDTYEAVARLRERRAANARVVMTLHGLQPDLLGDVGLFRGVLDGVACTNRVTAALVARAGIEAARIHYAPYGVELRAGSAPPVPPSADLPLRIAFVGRLEEWQKRASDLRPIADALAARGLDFELIIAGAGPEEAQLRQALAGHAAAGRVHFLGQLDAAQLQAQVYDTAHVLLVTSAWETGPIVAWEAMARGLAVVSSRYVGSRLEGALRDGDNALLFPVGDVQQAADCLARVRSPSLHARLSAAGRALVADRYTCARSVEAWQACLSRVLAAPPLPLAQPMPPAAPSGRLDRLFGVRRAETLRQLAGRRHRHSSAGGEWPHTCTTRAVDDPAFWDAAARADAGAA